MVNVRAPEELFPSHHRFHSETNIFSISTTSEQTSSLVNDILTLSKKTLH